MQVDQKTLVQSLIGISQLPFYLQCLKSLIQFGDGKFDLLLHTDGTITEKHENLIFSELEEARVTICDSNQNRERILDLLKGRPQSQKIRKESIWGIEFFDPLFANPEDPISFYLDADILFLKNFNGLFNRSAVEGGAIFLSDTQWDAYSFRPWQLLYGIRKPKVVKGLNTGLVFWDKRKIDWDYLEWFLGAVHLHHISEWVVPTLQAGLANQCYAKKVCPNLITNLYPNARVSEETFGAHLLGSYRKKWIKIIDSHKKLKKRNDSLVTARFDNCETQNLIGYSINHLKRWKNTRLNLW